MRRRLSPFFSIPFRGRDEPFRKVIGPAEVHVREPRVQRIRRTSALPGPAVGFYGLKIRPAVRRVPVMKLMGRDPVARLKQQAVLFGQPAVCYFCCILWNVTVSRRGGLICGR